MTILSGFEKNVRRFERSVEKFAKDAVHPSKKRTFFLEQVPKGEPGLHRHFRGTCEWCGTKGEVHSMFKRVRFAHALCADCQAERNAML